MKLNLFISTGIICAFGISIPCFSQDKAGQGKSTDSYQEIYTAVRDQNPLLDFNLAYRSGVSNPFNYSHGIDFALRFYFENRFYTHASFTQHLAGFNNFTGAARADLIESGFGATVAQTKNKYSLGGGVVFLDGVLNFFGARVVPFDVSMGLELGQTRYDTPETRFSFGPHLDFRGLFAKNFGVALTAAPIFEESQQYGTLLYTDVSLGIFARFY